MSYFADHLAWQQRVVQEFKASSQFLENQFYSESNQSTVPSGYQDLISYIQSSGKYQNDLRKSQNAKLRSLLLQGDQQAETQKSNLDLSTVVTKKDLLRERQGRSQTAAQKQRKKQPTQNPYSYQPKSKIQPTEQVKRSITLQRYQPQRGNSQTIANDKKVPEVDYQPRFNEEFDAKSFGKGGPKSFISVKSKISVHRDRPQTSKPQAHQTLQQKQSTSATESVAYHKQKILEVMEKLSEKDLEKMSKILQMSHDKKKEDQEDQNENSEQEQQQDIKLEDENIQVDLDRATNQDEILSKISRSTKHSHMAKSEISRFSNKTYINHLESQLNEEKEARKKLESELEELKKLSSEISSHLGLQKKQNGNKK